MPLLDEVREKVENAEQARAEARAELRKRVEAAKAEGIPLAAIARAAGLSRERIRQLVSPRQKR